MTIGENIRRLRKERNMTIQELADLVGVHESYIRAYETGRRHPKIESLERIAAALHVNVEVLLNADVDGVKAMHWLFHLYRHYDADFSEYIDEYGDRRINISFRNLKLVESWYDAYQAWQKEASQYEDEEDEIKQDAAYGALEEQFDFWMDTYPEKEKPENLLEQKKADAQTDYFSRIRDYGYNKN